MVEKIPLIMKLRRKIHRDIAYAQDLIVENIYKVFPYAVIHGGTAIWRCYNGNRFSEDIDVYIKKDTEKINEFFDSLSKTGFQIIKKRIKENSLYSALSINNVVVRFEAVFKEEVPYLKEYETSDGLFLNIYTLTPEKLIKEKINAYMKRRKIRDLYDIFFLLRYTEDKKEIKNILKKFVENFENPDDEENLKAILFSYPIPSSKEMLEYIRKWAK